MATRAATLQSRDQERAKYAWGKAQEGVRAKKEYVNLAKGAPALIMQNGLMQVLAYYQAKKGKEHELLLEHLCTWLGQEIQCKESFSPVMEKLHGSSSDLYLRATEEALEILRWLRHFADALKKADGSGDRS